MQKENFLTTSQILKKTGLKQSNIDYCIRERIITCIHNGKGKPRLYEPIVIDILAERFDLEDLKSSTSKATIKQ